MISSSPQIEVITQADQHIATIIRADYRPSQTTFVTPDFYYQQTGFIVYPEGGEVQRHTHLPLQRHLVGTPEALLVRFGKVEVALYSIDKKLIGTWVLNQNDLILLVAGGHGFRFLEDTMLLEIKQGPYTGLMEKEQF